MTICPSPVLILGAGINGAALARELALHRVPVCVVERSDIACGATAYSSRLIHGGLRYLEYGDFDLVRESLAERTRLLRLAPQFVQPLRLFVPVEKGNRFGGLAAAARRLLDRKQSTGKRLTSRGLWLVRAGLWFYDRYARDPSLPRHAVYRLSHPAAVPVDPQRYGWECAFHDAQIRYPERFVLALLEDARRLAEESGVPFQVWTYHEAARVDDKVQIRPVGGGPAAATISPAAVVNATGAWVDATLRRLQIDAPQLMAGTKGSHLITSHAGLCSALAGRGLYAEATDGRPVFFLPWGEQVLIGTTDLPFEGDPSDATAGTDEIDYLIAAVNRVLPGISLSSADVDLHYCGVRPLPHVSAATPSAVTRRHWTQEHPGAPWPLFSVIGGKLTTCRSLAEQTGGTILDRLGLPRVGDSRGRPLPGGADYPADAAMLFAEQQRLANALELPLASIKAVWSLVGGRSEELLRGSQSRSDDLIEGTMLPRAFVRRLIDQEWATTLDDLVERRLMLLYEPRLRVGTLRDVAQLLVSADRLPAAELEQQTAQTTVRLWTRFGKRVVGD